MAVDHPGCQVCGGTLPQATSRCRELAPEVLTGTETIMEEGQYTMRNLNTGTRQRESLPDNKASHTRGGNGSDTDPPPPQPITPREREVGFTGPQEDWILENIEW